MLPVALGIGNPYLWHHILVVGTRVVPGTESCTVTPAPTVGRPLDWQPSSRPLITTVSQAALAGPKPEVARVGITLSNCSGQRETRESRRSVLELSLRYGPLEARRTAFSVALAIFWRMRGEAQQPRT